MIFQGFNEIFIHFNQTFWQMVKGYSTSFGVNPGDQMPRIWSKTGKLDIAIFFLTTINDSENPGDAYA